MKYTVRKGIVLTAVCDQQLLVASVAAREYCPYVTRITETAAYIWEKLEQNYSLEQLYSAIREDFDTGEGEDIESMVNEYLLQLENSGYLIRREE